MLGFAVAISLLSTVSAVCKDVDTNACILLDKQNVCDDPYVAQHTCPRYCKLCPLECYHCDSPVDNFMDCNTTKACGANETCLLKTLRSTHDGHIKYEMTCAAEAICDGGDRFAIGKRDLDESRVARDLSIECCSTDLCNYPVQTTTTPSTTTTLPSTTTLPPCARDIEFLIDDSVSVSRSEFSSTLHFVTDVIRRLPIGVSDAMVGLATFDSRVHNQWDLDRYPVKGDLLKAVGQVTSSGGTTDTDAALQFAVNHAFKANNGDRPKNPDVMVLLTDGHSRNVLSLFRDAQALGRISKDVIVIGVGSGVASRELSLIATDPEHKLTTSSFNGLTSPILIEQVYNLICHDHRV